MAIPEIDTRIAQYEMAFQMQSSVPDLVDFSGETKATLDRYGADALAKGTFANNCLIARRLLERGVRFVQLMHAGWDQHGNLHTQLEQQCVDTEGPSAALVKDLKERGMLDDTLVIWGGGWENPVDRAIRPTLKVVTTLVGLITGGWLAEG